MYPSFPEAVIRFEAEWASIPSPSEARVHPEGVSLNSITGMTLNIEWSEFLKLVQNPEVQERLALAHDS